MDSSTLKSSKKSLFSRKPVKRSSTDSPSPLTLSPLDQSSTQDTPTEPALSPVPISPGFSSDILSLNRNRSIIPESLKELPSWYQTEGEWAAASALQFRARYPIHNPVGPHCYKNVHLLPPNRPSSVFSPSFPPMSAEPASAPIASSSHSPSGSPLPTPSSSQTRIIDPSGKVRTRKVSNTAHDNVDLLDASDPYGTNWHHESPYDGLGLGDNRNAVSPDSVDPRPPPRSRSRMSSLGGTASHHKTTTPSPLSQSTSAIHLSPDQDAPPITRKLTKRRKPFDGIFGFSHANPPDSASSIVSSLSPSTRTVTKGLFNRQSIFKSASTSSIPQTISNSSIEKRQKRGSMLGRFARRFSIMRRVTRGHSRAGSLDASNDWSRGDIQSLQVTDAASTVTRPASMLNTVSPSEKHQSTRVLPPRTTPSPDSPPLETPEEEQTQDDVQVRDANRDSTSSLQVPYSIGRLTIANPDSPGSTDNSPVNQSHPLPAGKTNLIPAQPPTLASPLVESPSTLAPPFNGFGSVPLATPSTPVMRVTLVDEGPKSLPRPLSSAPVPIPRPRPKSERRVPPSSPLSSTPIPTSPTPSPPTHPSTAKVAASSPPTVDDSPLSRASIIANPPTPYVEPTHIKNSSVDEQAKGPPTVHLSIPSPIVTPIGPSPTSPYATSPHESHKPPSRESSPAKNQGLRQPRTSSSVRSRETETFHLVRNPSAGAMQPTGESIIVGGEQWEVVGGGTQRSKSKKEKDDARRSHAETDRRASKRQERTAEKVAPSVPPKSESRKSRTKEGNSSRRHSQAVESKDHVRRSVTSPSSARASGIPAPAASPTAAAAPERRPSQSQGRRPTSELSPAAEMNAVRAREVWEMDRLWKGRSMAYGLEGPHVVYAQSIGDVGSTTSVNGHGSTHTSYKLQQGFPFPSPTAAAAAVPPPGMYSPQHPQQPQQQTMRSLYEYPSGVRSYPDLANIPSIGTPDSTPSLPSRMPLPTPPRQSAYRPGPIPASMMEKDDGVTAEYWSKYAGVGVVSSTH